MSLTYDGWDGSEVGAMAMVLRGATVYDGTGAPGRRADVAVEGGRIAAVDERLDATGAAVVDLDGLALAPGFIDVHTHYDAQVTWDPELTPSPWHGVTTVLMGNCGFGIAPTRPEDRATIVATLENVEGMSARALHEGIRWDFETFPQYLDAIDRSPKMINVAAMIGHTPLRLYVLGDDASDRAATPDEVATMRAIVAEAMAAGASGFATSRGPQHIGAAGKPVPSRLAGIDEIIALCDAVAEARRGVLQVTSGPGFFVEEFAQLARETDRPVLWSALVTGLDFSTRLEGAGVVTVDGARGGCVEMLELATSLDSRVIPQVSCRPLGAQLSMADPFALGSLPTFKEVLARPTAERADLYRDPAWRDRARPEVAAAWKSRLAKILIDESELHRELLGSTLGEVAARRGVDPFDLMIDLALEENLETRFRALLFNDDEVELAQLLRDPRSLLGLSDAGAHVDQLCDAVFSTHLLAHWVRETETLPLEYAVWKLTGQPAQVLGLAGRGLIAPRAHADLVAFDPATVAPLQFERVYDLPGGADRLLSESLGVQHVWVGGEPIRTDGAVRHDARPGTLLRHGGTA